MNDSAPQTVRVTDPSSDTLFDLMDQIGEGGMGTVYQARTRGTGDVVAVKLLKREADAVRFAREVAALARLSHPNIVRYMGHGVTEDGTQFVAMEWLQGQSLEAALRAGDLPLRRSLEIARDVAAALAHAHEAGVVHRDLKPSNIFLSTNGVKVLDFGVARFVGDTGFTQTGQVVGTPSYMAPEQARGDRGIGPAADLFSLGCVLYRCVTHEGPFTAPDVLAVLNRLATHTPPRLRNVPRALGDLVSRLLSKDPTTRPASAHEVERALEALLATDLQPEATPLALERTLESPTPMPKPRSRRVPMVIAALAALAGAGIYVAYALRHSPQPALAVAPSGVRAVSERACRTWGAEMARRQKSDGSFTGEAHRDPTGWDTAQELVALEEARSCAMVAPLTLRSATDALVKMKQPEGWTGPDRERRAVISVASDAWATLALGLAARADKSAMDAATAARSLLLSRQRTDGGFGYTGPSDPSDAYTTLIAAWALAVGEAEAPSAELANARQKAVAWLCTSFRASSELKRVAGFEEELLWVLAQIRREAPKDTQADDVFRTGASDLIARCGLDKKTRACTRPVYDDGEITIGSGSLVTLWHPWVGAAADAILSSPVTVADDVRGDLETITRWASSAIEPSIDALAALPEYKLAEYLMAASTLTAAH